MIRINPNLGASCKKDAEVKISWNAGYDCCNATLIKISPKGRTSTKLNFTAELDATNDFKTFIGKNTILNTCCDAGKPGCDICAPSGQCLTSPPESSTCTEKVYVLGNNFDPSKGNIVKLSFTVRSLYDQPGIDKIYHNATNATCTKVDNKTWNCNFNCIPCPTCPGSDFLMVALKGTEENNPTLWYIENSTATGFCPTDSNVKDVCCDLKAGYAGAWYGGVEALIPFVRYNPTSGYYTTIKLINRYEGNVKVYGQAFKGDEATGPMVPATRYLGTIPSKGGVLTLTGNDLATGLGVDLSEATAVKLLIRVPSQVGCMSGVVSVYTNIEIPEGATEYPLASVSSCFQNPGDPYVDGYVVYDAPQGTRTVPLKFKFWKNGAYAQ